MSQGHRSSVPLDFSRDRLQTPPSFWSWPLAAICCLLALIALGQGTEWVSAISGVAGWLGYGIVIAASILLYLNFILIRRLPFKVQTLLIWAELLIGFAIFFDSFDLSYDFIGDRLPFLLGLTLKNGFVQGAVMTLFISLLSILCATLVALAAALGRLSASGILFGIATFYTSFFRGTPLLLQVMLIYLGLPQIGIVLDAIPAGIIALSVCYGAYMAEIFRAGIEAVPNGQAEAGLAIGLSKRQVMWKIILPQALRLVIPPTGNQFISMLKDSSLVSVMGVWELMYLARTHGKSEFKYMEMLISAAVIYWMLSALFEFAQYHLERRLGKGVQI